MKPKKTKKIAVTGNIGSGKSIICKILSHLGYPVFYSDTAAKKILATHPDVKKLLTETIGPEAYDQNQQPNRKIIGEFFFADPKKLNKLNSLVHPALRKEFNHWVANQDSPLVFNESALVFETNIADLFFKVINVSATAETRLQRIKKRDPHRSNTQIEEIMAQQLPDEQKTKLADFTIVNNTQSKVLPQIYEIIRKLESF